MKRLKAVFNWSGGKDSAHALWRVLQSERYDIIALLTAIESGTGRTALHGIPHPLLEAQAASIGLPLHIAKPMPGDADYAEAFRLAVEHFEALGALHFIFGDIFLPEVRRYREGQLAPHGIWVVEPLWNPSPATVMRDFLASGLKTVVVAADDAGPGPGAIGRTVDRAFVDSLPAHVDPNGENSEYHTFCYDGPIFRSPVAFRLGEPVPRSYELRGGDGTRRTRTCWHAELAEA